MEEKLVKLATKVAKPITLASVVAIVLYLLYRAIIGLDIFAGLGENATFIVINSIISKVFYLALVTSVLGAIALSLQSYFKMLQSQQQREWTISGNVFLDNGEPAKGATVFVEGIVGSREADASGWFSIMVTKRDSWVVHGSHNGRHTEMVVRQGSIDKPVRLTIPSKEPEGTQVPPSESDAVPYSASIVSLLQDPMPFLQAIKQHLREQPSERDYLEPVLEVVGPLCQNDPNAAKIVVQQLVHEHYLVPVAGDRYQLSLKAKNALSRGRSQ